MESPKQITAPQATIVIASTIIGVGVLVIPRIAVQHVDTGAPLLTLLGLMVSFIGIVLIAALGKRFPQQSIIQYTEAIVGKWPARAGNVIIILFFMNLTALTAREFGEVVVTSVLRTTPLEITIIIMITIAAVAARNDIMTLTYIHQFYFPFIVIPALVIIAISLKEGNVLYLQPIWGNHPEGMLFGTLTIAAFFQGFFILTIIIPAMQHPKKAMKASVWAIAFSGFIYIAAVTASVAVFGPEEIKLLIWPVLDLSRMTSFPGQLLERLDVIFLALWLTAVFTTLYSTFYFTVHGISQLLRLRDHKMLTLSIIPFLFLLAMIPRNIIHLYQISIVVSRVGLLVTIGYPFLLWIVANLRNKKENDDAVRTNPQAK